MGQFSSFLKAWNGLRRANLTIQTHHFNPFKNQNYPPFFWNSSYVSSFRLPYTGLFLPCLLEPKELYSKWAKSDPKIVLYFTHRNGPTFGSKTDLFDLQCILIKPNKKTVFLNFAWKSEMHFWGVEKCWRQSGCTQTPQAVFLVLMHDGSF